MSDSIVAALISAVSSVLIAYISKGKISKSPEKAGIYNVPNWRSKVWIIVLSMLLIWLALSPALIHHDLAGTNFFVIMFVTFVLALAAPIKPINSASIVLALYASNYVLGPLSNRLAGSRYDARYEVSLEGVLVFIGIAFANALIIYGVCALFARRAVSKNSSILNDVNTDDLSLTSELERLGQLHEDGVLDTKEFKQAKAKLLAR